VFVPWLPGTLPITVRPLMYRSLPASHSCGWPGEAVFGYGFECRKFLPSPPPFAGAEAGLPSLFGPFGTSKTMNRCQAPRSLPSLTMP
jgi:hypothetical protein